MDREGSHVQVWVVGPSGVHCDFREALALLRAGARVTMMPTVGDAANNGTASAAPPAVIVIAQSRPGEVRLSDVERLRRRVPLAGVVSLLGSWCEGELRTGRPVPAAVRLYWHEFPPWWRRQLALLAAGRCPDWARPTAAAAASRVVLDAGRGGGRPDSAIRRALVVLHTPRWDTADALSDALRSAGYASLWQPPGRSPPQFRGAMAGIWEGGLLDDREADALAHFCRGLARDAVPVLALLDFPRHDRMERAFQLGAKAVLGKPWLNADLVAAIENLTVANATASPPKEICAA